MSDATHPSVPPEAWLPARRLADALRRPIEQFLHIEAASGILLLATAALALVWGNSAWHGAYENLWETPLAIRAGPFDFSHDLHFWINEVLMTVFFLVVGLEIKREMVEGALADMKRAALPVAAAVGGMVAPALIYLALNVSGPARDGWGVPMATDIAFAVGVLTLLGTRVPPPMRVLLLALAIIDDIGAILVIALFYSSGFAAEGMLIALGGVLLLAILGRTGVRPGWSSVAPLAVIWIGLYKTGVHPTLAGVIVGLGTSARSWIGREGFLRVAKDAVDEFEARDAHGAQDHELFVPLDRLAFARREALPPALRVQHALHPWVAYLIMPLFALANAGVYLGDLAFGAPGLAPVLVGVGLGLVVGKPLGVLLASWVVVRLKLAALPRGVGWREVLLVGIVAGIGFTMAIFIAELAFADAARLAVAKVAILAATAIAGTAGLALGASLLRTRPSTDLALSDSDVESSTEVWIPAVLQAYGSPTSEERHSITRTSE